MSRQVSVSRLGLGWGRERAIARGLRADVEGFGPLAVFLPASGKRGAALLRIYRIAEALRPLGWRTALLPASLTLAQRQRFIGQSRPDVLVMQGVRHALNRPHYYPGQTIVMDMDDADFHLPHLVGPLQRAMPHLQLVITGSDYVARWCRMAGTRAETVWTGAPVSRPRRPPQAARPPVIAWAQTRPTNYTQEAEIVRRVVREVAGQRPGTRLRLYDRCSGDDPGFADSFAAPGLTVEWRKAMSYARYLGSFNDVQVGLAPLASATPFSRGKSFGKVLAYLDRMVPVVASATGEHGSFFNATTGVLANTQQDWTQGVLQLLDNPSLRQNIADAAFFDFQNRLTTDAAVEHVDAILRQVASEERASRAITVAWPAAAQ